ncbi:MAG: caspase family protein [Desulfobacterales bacterium]|nr:caspase family protein [Desulfobacterales bacterium]
MKIFNKITLPGILIIFAILFLASCTTTPKLNLIKSSGVSMELTKPASYVFSVLFSPDGKYALSGSLDNNVTIWDIKTGNKSRTLNLLSGDVPGVSALSMSHDGKYLLAGMKGGGWVKLWNVETGKEIRSLPGHSFTEAMEALAFSPDGKYAVTGGSYLIKQWNVTTGKELGTIEHATFFERNQPYAMAFSPDRRYAFAKGLAGFISLWDIQARKRLWIYGANTGHYPRGGLFNTSVQFSPDGEYILSGEGEKLKLRDAASGQTIRTFVDEASGRIDAVAFSSDGKYALSGSMDGNIRLWDVQTGVKLKKFAGHSDEVSSVAFSPDGKYVLSGGDASTRLWDASTGAEIATMMQFDEREWLVITSEGYYNSSEKGAQYLNVKFEGKDYTVEQFYDVFYRPDIVAAKLRGEDISGLITITMKDAIKSPPPVVEISPVTPSPTSPKAKVCYNIKSTGGGIGEIRLFHNGKLIESDGYYKEAAKTSDKMQLASLTSNKIYEDMRSVKIKGVGEISPITSKTKGEVFEDCKEVDAIHGENEISITAFNKDNTVQGYMQTAKFNSTIKREEPHLYILSVGIDKYNDSTVTLKYATKDATDIEQKLLKQTATVYKPQNIHYELLTDDKASKGSIINKINELSRVVKPNDGFIFFVAGHGVLLQSQYYMLTHEYNGTANENAMISSNEIVEMSKKIKSLSQLFIFDTCHAGGVDYIVSGLYDARMSVLAKKMGLHIYASANSKEAAMDGYQGNGLFTYTLLDGLNNKKEADKNNDKKISLVELGEYSKQTTAELSKKIGHQQTPLIINFGKDNAVYNLR